MMSFYLSGGVEVLGFISPTEPTDEYPVIDPLYGIDGFRNVNTLSDLNSIPNLRRRAGMVVGVSGGTQYYKLNPSPWNGIITDWSTFNSGSGGGTFTGGTVTGDTIFTQGLTATTFSASTYLGLPLDVYVTGGTYSNGTLTFTNNSGGTFDVSGLYTGTTGGTDYFVTGGTFNKNTETLTLERNDGNSVPITGFTDVYTTGFTFNPSNYDISIKRNDGVILTQNLSILASDVTITGGTYNPLNGVATFTNNTGGTFSVSGFITGFTDVQVTGYTYQDNTFKIFDSSGNVFPATINTMTGLTVNGNLTVTGITSLQEFSATTISATTIGLSGNCVDDIYVSNIHSCSPLNINPIDEGNVYFGSTSGVTFDLINNKVGIGTSTPNTIFHVVGNYTGGTDALIPQMLFQNSNTIPNTNKTAIIRTSVGTGYFVGGYPEIWLESQETSTGVGLTKLRTVSNHPLLFYTNDIERARFGETGNFGINTQNPAGKLHIRTTTNQNIVFTSGTTGNQIRSLVDGNATYTGLDLDSLNLNLKTNGLDRVVVDSSGNVGIGTTTPTEKLDVSGKTKTINLQVTSGATAGYILTALDGSGNVKWEALGSTSNELDPVLTITGTTASTVNIGDRFLISGGTGIWSGRTNQIAEYTGVTPTDYSYYIPVLDDVVFVTDTLTTYRFDGTNWVSWRGTAILQNGNSLTTSVNIGSNNNQNLNLRTSGQTRVSIDTSGSTTLFGSTTLVRPQGSDYLVFSSSTLANSGQTMYIRQIASNTHVFGTNLLQTFMQVGPGNRINLNGQELTTNGSAVFGANRIGNTNMLNLNSIPSGTTGTTDWRGVLVNPTVNFGGTYSGNFIGYLHNPTITSMANGRHIAMQIVSGDILLNTTSGNVGIGTTTPSAKLQVSGTTLLQTFTGTTGLISAATQNVLTIVGSGNTNSSPIFSVQGSSGELFSVSDSLVGSLFSVNDISGLPILEVFSDNTTLMGSYLAPSLNTTARVIATTGTTNVYSIPTSAYTGAFFDYTVSDGTNLRAGNIMSIWSGTSVNITETQTTDFGNTSGLTFNMVVSSGNAILRTSGVTGNWTVKTIVRSI